METPFQWKLFTSETPITNESKSLNELASFPNVTIHYRKPKLSKQEYYTELNKLSPLTLSKTMIHEHHELSIELDVKGIHYKSNQSLYPFNNQPLSSKGFHDFDTLLREGDFHHYVFISPLFSSISKNNYHTPFSSNEIKRNLSEAKKKNITVIGLGGISITNIELWSQWSLKGVGLLGYLWESKNPLTKFEELLKIHQSI